MASAAISEAWAEAKAKEAAQITLNEAQLDDLTARYESIADVEHAALFLSIILSNLFLTAHRQVDEEITSTQNCIFILSRNPQLHELLNSAHAAKDYRAVSESPLIPPFVSTHSRSYLEGLRSKLKTMIDQDRILEPWDPKIEHKDLNWDEDTLSHIQSLNLVCRTTTDDFSIALFDLGSFEHDPVSKARASQIFTKQNKFLVNASGTGKTRLLYEGLCVNWGLYSSYHANPLKIGSVDVQNAVRSLSGRAGFRFPDLSHPDADNQMRNNARFASHAFATLLLARLLIFHVFLEVAAASPSGITHEHKKRWLLFQLCPKVLDRLDPFHILAGILNTCDALIVPQTIAEVYRKIQKLLGNTGPHLFIILDEVQAAAKDLRGAFMDNKPLLPIIMREWSSHITDGCSFIFSGDHIPQAIFSGNHIPRSILDDTDSVGGDYIWCSATGSFGEPTAQERYVTKLLPPALATSPSGRWLIARIWRWLRGRHGYTAAFIHALINGGLETPHTRLNDYIREHTRFEPQDAIDEVAKEVAAAGLESDRLWTDNFRAIDFSKISVETRSLLLDILFRYMATQQESPPLGLEHIDLVNSDYALFIDGELSSISVAEPLILVAAARKLLPHPSSRPALQFIAGHPNNYPDTFLGSMRLNAPRTARALSHCLVFYLARVLGEPRPLSDIFHFPHKVPTWAKQSGQLIRFHRETLEVEHSTVSLTDTSLPLATETSSAEETAAWLDHRHGTAFCLPSASNPDILFSLKLADGCFIWVALRAMATDEPIQVDELKAALSQLEARNLFTGEGDNTAINALDVLPQRSSKLGTHSLLRVVASFPVEIDLERCVTKRSRDIASLSLAALEGTDAEVTQPEFFDSIIAGVLAGSKRNPAWSVSGHKRHRSADVEHEDGEPVPPPTKKKRATKTANPGVAVTPPASHRTRRRRRKGVNRRNVDMDS
ncbi:hypothetical protein C8R46DRAFT_334629 [Mycena filopes]|nr:hypothetical protein C8R46DRAFT_334629 [Mycena filopes]